MLMHHSEPLADANDPPQEVSIQLQQLAGDAQEEEDRNSAPPDQPTPFAPPAENDSEPTQNYMASAVLEAMLEANANDDIPQEVTDRIQQQMADDAQLEEYRNSTPPADWQHANNGNSTPPAPPTGSTPIMFALPAENGQGNPTVPANALLIAVDSSLPPNITYDGTVYSKTATATVKQLIASSRFDVDERCGKGGEFALMHAAALGHTAIVQALLEASANVNLLCYGGRSALMWAARNGHTSVVQALLQASASVDLQSNAEFTALMWAAWYGHTAIVWALLKASSASVNLQSKLGYTALMAAAWNGHTTIVQALLDASASVDGPVARARPVVDQKSSTGKTALMIAAANGRTAIVRLLLAAGADITLLDTRGANAETFAKRRNQAAAILLLQGKSLRTCMAFGKRAFAAAARVGPTGRYVDQRLLVAPAANLQPQTRV